MCNKDKFFQTITLNYLDFLINWIFQKNLEPLNEKKDDSHGPDTIFPKEGGRRDTFVEQ